MFAFDDFYEFVDHVSDGINDYATPEADAVEHFEHLPEVNDPEAFDKYDDSLYNDQDDSERE